MAGSTDNTDLLKALNQAVKAINDLVLGGGTTVIEAPDVTVRPNITINCSCGNTGGSKLEDPPVNETDPPPVGYEPDPNIDERKCKAANYIYYLIYKFLTRAKLEDWDDMSGLAIVIPATLVGALLGVSLGGPLGAIVGATIGIAAALISGVAIQLDDIIYVMDDKKPDLICAFYNAGDTTAAKNDFLSVLSSGGLNSVELQAFMSYFLYSDVLKLLFYGVDWVSESELAAYTGSEGCDGCGGGVVLIPLTMCGVHAGVVTNQSGNLYTVQSAQVQWGCNPASPMQSIVLMFDVTCNVKVHSGDRVFTIIGTNYGSGYDKSFATYFGVSAAIATNDAIGLHLAGTTTYTVVFEIEAI
jgi:hypothetical protein